jgi:NADP-dependent 3-hydroxy acid dehydrogenase YdfG
MSGVGGRLVVVTGAAGTAGRPATRALAAAGARVVAVGQSPQRLSELAAQIPGIGVEVADLGDPGSVQQLSQRIHANRGPVDGIVHLVGGFRGGASFGANTDADWRFLDNGLIQTLRHVTLAFHDDLVASPAGRAVIVSGTAVDAPSAGSANYATAKAAAETWMRALADSFHRSQSGRKDNPLPQTSAAVILVVKALVDEAMREVAPDRKFPGFTDVSTLAAQIVALWSRDAAELNGARIPLTG